MRRAAIGSPMTLGAVMLFLMMLAVLAGLVRTMFYRLGMLGGGGRLRLHGGG